MSDLMLILALLALLGGAIAFVYFGFRFRKGSAETRDYPVFGALSDEVGRAAEEGALIHLTLGSGDLGGEDAVTTLAACEGVTALCDLSAAYDTPPIITTGDPTVYLLADDWMRRAYARLGNVARYRPTLVQYMAATPMTYAALSATYLYERGVGTNVMLGAFDQESAFLVEAALRNGTPTSAGAVSPVALGALYPALSPQDLAVGEDLFAAGAEAIGKPAYAAGLWTEQTLRWLIAAGMVGLAILSLLGIGVGGA